MENNDIKNNRNMKIGIISNSQFICSFLKEIGHNSEKNERKQRENKRYDIFGKFALQ